MANPTSEDDVIKKRLLIEGDSGNEDRLINKLIKNFVKWSSSAITASASAPHTNGNGNGVAAAEHSSPAADQIAAADDNSPDALLEQVMASLSHAEFGLLRNQFVLEMNKLEQNNYDVLYQKINSEIARAKKKILESKLDLHEARKIRKNRQEYDILAKQIVSFPNRLEMQATIRNLEERVEVLKRKEQEYEKKIDLRRKQFSVVLQSLSSMKNLLETDSKLEDYLDGSHSVPGLTIPITASADDHTAGVASGGSVTDGSALKTDKKSEVQDLDDMDDEYSGLRREKHFSTNEVDMEDSNL